MPVQAGEILEGKVTGITNFGAFIELPGGVTGLVHISEIAEEYVKDIHDFFKVSDRVKVKVITVDPRGKIGLSIKQALEKPRRSRKPEISFEEKINRFMKDSDERLTSLRRNTESKRGGRGAGKRS
ncbi:MAG: S1 RNA-binding domain-containing protein [Desulfotomaculaceae bacterium]